jgi:hypothetical protein
MVMTRKEHLQITLQSKYQEYGKINIIVKLPQENTQHTYKGKVIRVTLELSTETLKARKV